tara:strand:- start:1034 stop:1474 length:441 start_codon:yes stop_codon:yes gene_type:complete
MNYKSIYFTITFIIIPFYIFFTPIKDYLDNFNKITYSLEIPYNKIDQDKDSNYEYDVITLKDKFLLEKKVTEAWVLAFPSITNKEMKQNFIDQLEIIGITSIVDLKSNDNNIFGIGPFVDKKMAELMAAKINKSTGNKGLIKRLNN